MAKRARRRIRSRRLQSADRRGDVMRLAETGSVTNARVVRELGISPATAHRVLRGLVEDGLLVARGAGRSSSYAVAPFARRYRREGLEEDRVWADVESALTNRIDQDTRRTLAYVVTEMVN